MKHSVQEQPRNSTEKPSLWELGGLSWSQLLKRLWRSMDSEHDDSFGRAAELAYYFFLAVFPALLFLMTLLGLLAGTNPDMRNTLFGYAQRALPPSAWDVVDKTIIETTQSSGGWKLLVGVLGSLWSASSGIASMMTVLNFVYHVKERRAYWKTRLVVAVLLTIALAALVLGALGIVLFGTTAAVWPAITDWATPL